MYFVCAGCGQCFYLTSPEVTWKDTSSIFPETKKIQSLPNLSFMPTKTGHCWKPYSFVMVMVWFWLFCTLWARRHNYLHITKLSQTAATRNQQVSVNDKRCLSKRKRISQLGAAAALQTSRSGWIWEGYIVTQRLLELIGPSWDYNFQVPRAARQLAAQLMMINSEGWSGQPILHCAPSVSVWYIMPRYDREFHRFEE